MTWIFLLKAATENKNTRNQFPYHIFDMIVLVSCSDSQSALLKIQGIC